MNKKPDETRKLLKAFFVCVVISLTVMLALMGFFTAHANSEYALNGKKTEYVTAPEWAKA